MSLTEDQRAMLQLLLEGGESYEDLSSLLGVPADEVRQRAATALQDLGGAFHGSRLLLVDYLLGQADPGARGYAEDHLADSRADLATARRLHARLRLLYPAAALPELPGAPLAPGEPAEPAPKAPEPGESAKAPAAGQPTEAPAAEVAEPAVATEEVAATAAHETEPEPVAAAADPQLPAPEPIEGAPGPPAADGDEERPGAAATGRPALTHQQKRLLALLVAAGLAIVVIVLGISGAFDSGDSSGASSTSADTTTAKAGDTVQGDETMLTRAVLRPQGNGKGNGVAIFGAVDEETPVLQVTAEGLEPTTDGEQYSIWLYGTDKIALRLAGLEVGKNGQIATQIELPAEALNFIVDGTLDKIDVSLNTESAYRQEMRASQREERLPRRVGKSVLRGPITGPGLGGTAAGDQ